MEKKASNQKLPLPPFGRILLAYQQDKVSLDPPIYVYVGIDGKKKAYEQKRMGILCSFVPYLDDPTQYNWPVTDQKIVVIDTGSLTKQQWKAICVCLMQFKPRVMFVYSEQHGNQLINTTRK